MKNENIVANLLLYGDKHPTCLKAFVMLSGDSFSMEEKYLKILGGYVPDAGSVLNGAHLITATMVACPDNASDVTATLLRQPRKFFVGQPEKPNELVFMSVVCGLIHAVGYPLFGSSTETVEKRVSDLLVYLLTTVSNRTKEDCADGAVIGALSNNVASYMRPKEYILGRTDGVVNLLSKLGQAGNERLLTPGPFATRVLDEIRHKALGNLSPYLSLLALSRIFKDGYRAVVGNISANPQ